MARILSISFILAGAAQAGQPTLEFEAFAGHDSNPSRAQVGNGIAGENVYGAGASMLHSTLLDEYSGLSLKGGATLLGHRQFSDLNELAVSANLRYRVQPIIGYIQPWYQLSIELERQQFAYSAMRNATQAAFELSAGKHITDRIGASAGIGIKRGLADHGQVFDRSERKTFIATGYTFGQANTFYAQLTHTSGDQVFGADESSYLLGNIKASAEDPVFGQDFYAYRMAATANIAEVGVNLPLRGAGTLDISAKGAHTAADNGPAYAYRQLLIGWRYRFF